MMYVLIVFLPLLGAILAGFFSSVLKDRGSQIVTSGFLVVSALLSWVGFFDFMGGAEPLTVDLASWMQVGDFSVNWALRIDMLTQVMLVVVTSVSALVHIYSIGYMAHDPSIPRFFSYLSLFTFAMLMLVTADNLVQLYFGWEGVGLASYLLIGFWYEKPSAGAAAIKAFLVNRVGDFGFALGIFTLFFMLGTVNFDEIFAAMPGLVGKQFNFLGWQVDVITTASLLLFVGAMGKSAQIGLHTWLPDAMEGPTPVSALIHAATMVTAGVFMVARLSPVFEYSETALTVVTVIGAATAFFAATVGMVQNDIKRVIAYSTCSQLGYMFFALGVGAYPVAIFHLFTHAFFKALLFLGAGSVIHAVSDEQDLRKMGGLAPHIRQTWILMAIGSLALAGIFPFAGYFSKDAILEAAFASGSTAGVYAYWLGVAAAVMTAFYSMRLFMLAFHGRPRAPKEVMDHVHESPKVMLIPLYFLGAGAIASGFLFAGPMIGEAFREFWGPAIYIGEHNEVMEAMHNVPGYVKLLPLLAGIGGILIGWIMYGWKTDLPASLARTHQVLYQFLLNKWYFDEIYDFLIVRPILKLGRILWKQGDGRIIDGFGPDGVSALVVRLARRAAALQTGYLYHYAFAMLIGVAALITYFFYNLGL